MNDALSALCRECPLRLCPQAHCHHAHYAPPGGRPRCFAPGSTPPDGWEATAAQRALWLARREAEA